MAIITQHAAEQYVERVNPALTTKDARTVMMAHAAAIDTAARFGADCVIIAKGVRLKLKGDFVATVLTSRAHRHG